MGRRMAGREYGRKGRRLLGWSKIVWHLGLVFLRLVIRVW